MSAVGNRRLLVLAEFLETGDLGKGQFDMRRWSVGAGKPFKLGDCGTAACALGWATTIPSFRRAGLRLNEDGDPTIGGSTDPVEAAQWLFSLNWYVAGCLFMPMDMGRLTGKRGRKVVAGRIRKLVARLEAQS